MTIAIIGVLLGVLLPALNGVRNSAKSLKCLSNLRQIALGWNLYLNEHHNRFPFEPSSPDHQPHHMFDWGGVDWFGDDGLAQLGLNYTAILGSHRPLNPYIGSDDKQVKSRAEIFLCPSDTNVKDFGSENNPYYNQYGSQPYEVAEDATIAEDAGETVFASIGTSYRANEWIWTRVGSLFGQSPPEDWDGVGLNPNIALKNTRFLVTHPSKFILVGDYGPFLIGRAAIELRDGIVYGWWHGDMQSNMAFLDGSARRVTMEPGTAATHDYTFYLDPDRHKPWSWVYARGSQGTPDPAEDEGDKSSGP